ncbi:Meiotically up-regulated gene 60 protein [Rhodotorula toruloides]|nr:Meiotically up-regulated gene 60 protein [Rhodotorula toruloides]
MDIYTTSFCLPRSSALSTDLVASPSSSFDLAPQSPTSAQPAQQAQQAQQRAQGHQASQSDGAVAVATPSAAASSASPTEASSATRGHSTSSSVGSGQGAAGTDATSVTGGGGATGNGTTGGDGSQTDGTSAAGTAPTSKRNSVDFNDAMQRLCVDTMAAHQCIVSFTPIEPTSPVVGAPPHTPSMETNGAAGQAGEKPGKMYNVHLSGGYQQVMAARGHVLRESPFKRKSVVKVPRAEVLDGKENVKVEMRRKLDEIASLTKAHLAIVGQATASIGFGLETERNVEIVITGPYESVEQARVRLLVLLDELSGLHSEVCEIDYKLHPILSGRKRCVIQTIQEETATNIYFPTPLSGVLGQKNLSLLAKQNLIFITGEFFGVQRARDMLFQVSLHKSKCIISRDTAILPRKLDWMLSDRLEDIKQIMNDNGTFISFPPIGSQASLISVYGDHRVNIERTIRSIMALACQFYVASFWLLPASFDVFMPPPTINPAQIPPILRHISVTSGAEAVFKSNCFEFHGLESEVRAAVQLVLELDFVKAFHHEIRFQIELANEHREFISGKKNGKLNKIMKSANVKIKFETFNDYNFLIDVAGNDPGVLHGLTMLQEELPAEISFHVPEAYHKRIIGVGGKNIQRIMKKYGVYVKFSNAEEFAALGGYNDNEDNVVARTPAKNAMNLEHLKQSVMELVAPKDKDFIVETVSIPRRYHRTLLGEKAIFIHDIEAKTNSHVRFPNKETASDVVSIFGPESQVHIAAQMLLDHVPFEAEYRLPHSTEMANLALSQDFVSLTEKIKRDLNITILPWVDRSGGNEETIIRFCLNRSNVDFLATCRDLVEEYLVQRNINLYPGSLRPRSDSFADVFAPFNSKLLSTSTMTGEGDARPDPRPGSDRKLRLAASSPNIKAIFDANPGGSAGAHPQHPSRYPSAGGPIAEVPPQVEAMGAGPFAPFYPAPPVPRIPPQYAQHQPPPHHHQVSPAHHPHFGPGPFASAVPQPHQMPPHQADYHWGVPRPMQGFPSPVPAAAPGYPSGPVSPAPGAGFAPIGPSHAQSPAARYEDGFRSPLQRSHHGPSASFSVAPSAGAGHVASGYSTLAQSSSVEDKLKDLSATSPSGGRQPRSLAGRAQSLDLSQHAAAFTRASTAPRHEAVDEVASVLGGLGLN